MDFFKFQPRNQVKFLLYFFLQILLQKQVKWILRIPAAKQVTWNVQNFHCEAKINFDIPAGKQLPPAFKHVNLAFFSVSYHEAICFKRRFPFPREVRFTGRGRSTWALFSHFFNSFFASFFVSCFCQLFYAIFIDFGVDFGRQNRLKLGKK